MVLFSVYNSYVFNNYVYKPYYVFKKQENFQLIQLFKLVHHSA